MVVKADIEKQMLAGFTKDEIFMNVQKKGAITQKDFDRQYAAVSNNPSIRQRFGSVSPGSIVLGILFLVVMIWRLSRYQNSGNILLLVGGVAAFILAILYFTRKS